MPPSHSSDPSWGSISPNEAFAMLGNETRVRILQTLGVGETPLSFTEVRDRVGIGPGKEFNYHIDMLVGHFVEKSEAGYSLRGPGERIVKAIFAGTASKMPTLDRVQIDHACQLCGAPIEVQYSHGRVEVFCSDCTGIWERDETAPEGYLGAKYLPPAGVHDRTPTEVYRTAWLWTHLRILSVAGSMCPNCSATLEKRLEICEEHDPSLGRCQRCRRRYAVRVHFRCRNCIMEEAGTGAVAVAANQELLDFMTDHGLNPLSSQSVQEVQQVFSDYKEEIRSLDPFEAQFIFSIRDETLALTVDEDLTVVGTSG